MHYQIAAIIILLIFYGCYFGKMMSQKKKGIQTDQLGKGKSGFIKIIEITMKIVTILVPIAEVISICINTTSLPDGARTAGIVVAALGDLIFIISVVTMRDSWRAGVSETEKTELVTNGIYRFSRNPAFLGFDLVYIGILLMFFNWVLLAVSVAAMVMFHLQIVNVEEDFLMVTFGEDYLDYRKRVCRYIGRKPFNHKALAILLVIWLMIGIVDYSMVHGFEKPLFCIVTEAADDGGSGHYMGAGYSFDIEGNFMPEDELPGVTKYTYYIFGIEVGSGIRD